MSQQDKSTLQAAINTQLADNTSGDISAADVRDNMINMTDSLVFNEGTGQTITGGLTVTGGITGSLQGTATTASYFSGTVVSASYAATSSISNFANSSNNILHADFNSNGDYSITFTSGIGYGTVLCRLNQATGLSPFTYNPGTSLLKITGSIITTGGITGSLQGTATTASYAATASVLLGSVVSASYAVTSSHSLTSFTSQRVIVSPMSSPAGTLYPPLGNISNGNSDLYTIVSKYFYDLSKDQLFVTSVSSSFTGSLLGTATTASYAATASLSNETIGAGLYGGEIQFKGGTGIGSPNGKNTYSSAFTWNTFTDGLNIGDPNSTGGNGAYYLAVGVDSLANGNYSVAFGSGSYANGLGSFTHGKGIIVIGDYSHAEGIGTVASGSYQHVQGKYNTHGDTTSLMIVGSGTSNNTRKDAFKVTPSGSIVIPTTQSANPSWTGTDGETVYVTTGGSYYIAVWLDGQWRSTPLM